ncbi:MAG: hypothetical protein R3B47_20510 [Bacteroidia bacterium]
MPNVQLVRVAAEAEQRHKSGKLLPMVMALAIQFAMGSNFYLGLADDNRKSSCFAGR